MPEHNFGKLAEELEARAEDMVRIAAALRAAEQDRKDAGRAYLTLLYNIFCMGTQELDTEWEYQWRQLMQAVELELSAAHYPGLDTSMAKDSK